MTPEPTPLKESRSPCAEKARIIEDLSAAMNKIIALNNHEIESITTGKIDALPEIDRELERARQYKDSLLLEFKSHIETHGC